MNSSADRITTAGQGRRGWLRALVALALVCTSFATADACTVCMGREPEGNVGDAMNAAIFLMLGSLALVLGLLSAFGIYLYRRSQTPIPPHVQLAETIGTQTN